MENMLHHTDLFWANKVIEGKGAPDGRDDQTGLADRIC
jgi:hypothetical protein